MLKPHEIKNLQDLADQNGSNEEIENKKDLGFIEKLNLAELAEIPEKPTPDKDANWDNSNCEICCRQEIEQEKIERHNKALGNELEGEKGKNYKIKSEPYDDLCEQDDKTQSGPFCEDVKDIAGEKECNRNYDFICNHSKSSGIPEVEKKETVRDDLDKKLDPDTFDEPVFEPFAAAKVAFDIENEKKALSLPNVLLRHDPINGMTRPMPPNPQPAILDRYKCFNEVFAFKIRGILDNEYDNGTSTLLAVGKECGLIVSNSYLLKHNPQVGGYYVRYYDGYESYSPAEAFENGYAEMVF